MRGLTLLVVTCAALAIVLTPGFWNVRTGTSPLAAGPPGEEATGPENPHARLESALAQLAEAFSAGDLPSASQEALQMALPLDNGQVRVIIEAKAGRSTEATGAVVALDGQVEKVRGDLIQAGVPVAALEGLASSGNVEFVRLPYRRIALVTGEGVALINADDWHAAGFTGSGVKVAILDLGFEGYLDLLGTELPDSVVTHSCRYDGDITGGGEKHGTGVAEVVHEVAPDAQLYLVNFNTDVEFAECVDWIIAQGVDVVNHSVGWFLTGPGDGSGPINDVVSDAVDQGVFWANAAGNQAQRHWSGPWVDGDGDTWLEFSGNDEGNNITISVGGPAAVVLLKWDDPFGASCNNYNLYLRRTNGATAVASLGIQNCFRDPVEWLSYEVPGTYQISIRRQWADGTANFHLYTFYHHLEHQVAAGSLLEPADNPSVLAVGAVPWSSPDTIEYFSSQGPTYDGRIKPDLVGPDGVSNATYSSFFGTSASSPHAAAAAALVLEANPGWGPSQIRSFLEGRAVDLGSPGSDNVYGAGRLDLAEPEPTLTPTPTPTLTPTVTLTATPTSTPTATPIPDTDGDGCTDPQEESMSFDPLNYWDFYDVPVPANPDPTANGVRDRAIGFGDVGAVLFYAGALPSGTCGDNPNGNGVDYDCDKDADGTADGVDYDRTASAEPNPPWEAGPPDDGVSFADVGTALAQAGLDCSELG